jgi:hypothetical protein
VQPLLDYLQLKNTKSFIILVNGRIVLENILMADANAFGTGQVPENINVYRNHCTTRKHRHQCKVSQYIGTGWTSLPIAKENLITNKHLLNMGLDDSTDDVTRLTSPTKPMREHAGPITMYM